MHRPIAALVAAGATALLGLVAVAPPPASADSAKVTSSTPAPAGGFPSQVALLTPGVADPFQAQFCGGDLIDPSWVLTAAHCIDFDGQAVDVLWGTDKLDGSGTRVAGTATVHPGFDFPVDDIALIHLAQPAAAPVAPLAYVGMDALEAAGTPAIVTGWGRLTQGGEAPVQLQQGAVPVLGDADCDARLAVTEPPDDLPDEAYDGLVCAGAGTAAHEDVDACQGDSGGPLWATGPDGIRRQIGIVSGGPTCGHSPTYYTSVTHYIDFIEAVTGRPFASFGDIVGNTHEANIERIVLDALTGGIGNGLYGPSGGVSRGQLATFVARALHLSPVPGGPFSDVAGSPHEGFINAVAAAGIVQGFSDGTYRPSAPVTREQMATFLARAVGLDPVEQDQFTDIATSSHRTDINAVALAGIAGGIGGGAYGPAGGVTRAQMATFLANAFV